MGMNAYRLFCIIFIKMQGGQNPNQPRPPTGNSNQGQAQGGWGGVQQGQAPRQGQPQQQGYPQQGVPQQGRPQQKQGRPMQNNPQQRGQPQQGGGGPQAFLDFNRVSQMPSKYPREDLAENLEENMQLGGKYQEFVYSLGNCCGNIRICCPCCCCVEYPYQQIDQSFVGIYERFGRYVKTMGSGLQYFNPFTDRIHLVDMKTNIINLTKQKALTKDNIEVIIDAAVYYHVKIARKTFYSVENIDRSVRELTFATLRSISGQYVLQDLLEKRDEVTLELGKFVARQVHEWGIEITNILIKDIVMNKELQDTLSAVAKEKRLAESKILNAQAEVESAKLMRQTADILSGKAAMQIRYLQALKGIASNSGVKVVFLAEDD